MGCDQWSTKLDTYLDGELSADEMRAFDAHVRDCPACAADALARVQMKRMVQNAGKRFVPSAEFRRKMLTKTSRRRPLAAWAWGAVALLLLVGLSLAYVGQQRSRRMHLFSELADLHVATMASANPIDVASSDRHTVKPWFQGKIPFSFNLPELQNSEFTLIGGRVAYLNQTPGAQLIYQIRQHRISVFVFQDRALPDGLASDSRVRQQLSFNQKTFDEGGLRFFLVGDSSPDDISRLAELLQKAQQP
jgi:anti-sigma factor RsiW